MAHILIVDDEPHIVELERAILEVEGFDITSAGDGEEAIEVLKKIKPDLVILDMMMPGMSGREVAEKIKSNPKTKELKIIFVTVAKFSEVGQQSLKEMGVIDYITKPFDNDDFISRINNAIKN